MSDPIVPQLPEQGQPAAPVPPSPEPPQYGQFVQPSQEPVQPAAAPQPQYGQQPAYQQPTPYQQPYAQQQPYGYAQVQYSGEPTTNTLAIVALILGFLVPIGGIICGHISLGQIKRTGQRGHGMALAGTILGYVFTALAVLYFIFIIVVIAAIPTANLNGTSGFNS